jgi:hypothetical protein
MSAAVSNPLAEIQTELAEYMHDPLGFVTCNFPWGEGELAHQTGPRNFQRKFLIELGAHLQNPDTRYKPFRKAFSSGHGIGKSALLSWLVNWSLSTFEDCKVIIMAGTGDQLKTKTQPEISTWFRRAANADLFEVNVTSIKVREEGHEQTWRADLVTWSEENPQASAGAHNAGKRLVIIFDEASGISDTIYKTVEGALTDAYTEIIWLLFSQCTRGEGAFYQAVFGDQKHRWRPEVIDSRTVEGVNVEEINESIQTYGADSDQTRVRYLGLFPLAGEGKYIDLGLVQAAQKRAAVSFKDDPLIVGVDFAWGGADNNVARFRKGLDARSIPPVKVRGEFTRDPAVMTGKLADILTRSYNGDKVAMMFVDGSGVGGNAGAIVARLHQMGHKNVMEINFGHDALDNEHYALRRDEMWGNMKNWLASGAIDGDHELAADLQKPVLISDKKQRIKLEPKDLMKKRLAKMGIDSGSPDDGDALALTFAMPVAVKKDPPKASSSYITKSGPFSR